MASQDGRAAIEVHGTCSPDTRPWALSGPQRIAAPLSVAVLIGAAIGVALDLPGRSASVIAAAAVALTVAAAGIAFVFRRRPGSSVRPVFCTQMWC
jgi:hypothetical protein